MFTNEEFHKFVNEIYRYNIKYKYWFDGDLINEEAPFYSINKDLPPLKEIEKNGINCAGLINIFCRKFSKIPFLTEYDIVDDKNVTNKGGTDSWFLHLYKNNLLEKINIFKSYPTGTLLVRNYINEYNQGHLAIKMDDKPLFLSRIIHARSNELLSNNMPDDVVFFDRKLYDPGVIIEPFNISNSFLEGRYYKHIVVPDKWLNNNTKINVYNKIFYC